MDTGRRVVLDERSAAIESGSALLDRPRGHGILARDLG
jgi:hypothetical protein